MSDAEQTAEIVIQRVIQEEIGKLIAQHRAELVARAHARLRDLGFRFSTDEEDKVVKTELP